MAESLRRYTNALALLDMLREERLTLLSPSRWFDQNDALGLEAYGKIRGDGSTYAMCFAIGIEQAHHWQLFAGSDHGVCIRFDREELSTHLNGVRDPVLHGPVIYENLEQIKHRSPIDRDVLPFLKRDTFKAEQEYRIVTWRESFFANATCAVPLPSRLIQQVIFGPAMPDSFVNTLVEISRERKAWTHIRFAKSRLVNNASWASAIARGVKSQIT